MGSKMYNCRPAGGNWKWRCLCLKFGNQMRRQCRLELALPPHRSFRKRIEDQPHFRVKATLVTCRGRLSLVRKCLGILEMQHRDLVYFEEEEHRNTGHCHCSTIQVSARVHTDPFDNCARLCPAPATSEYLSRSEQDHFISISIPRLIECHWI